MDRLLQGAPGTLSFTLYSGTTPTDPGPDTATIEVTSADGSVVVAAGSPATNDGTGGFTRALTPAQTASLDILTARWTMTIGSATTLVTRAEVAGGFLCTLAELKAEFPDNTDTELAMIRTAAEQRIESACRRAFVPRLAVETRTGARRHFYLAWPDVRAIRFASVGDTVLSQAQLDALQVTPSGEVLGLPFTSLNFYRITVGYEYGLDSPTEIIREAVVLAADETFSNTDDAQVIRREADRQSVTFASPTSTGSFQSTQLRRIVRDHAAPLLV